MTDVRCLFGRDVIVVGTLDGDRVACQACEPGCLLAGVAVKLQQVAARQRLAFRVCRHHLGDVDAVSVDSQLVGELVASAVFAVDDDIHRLAPGHVAHTHAACYLEGHEVAHQGFVVVVVDECPLLGLGRRAHVGVLEDTMRLVELDAVGLLGMCHRSVAAQARCAALFLYHRAVGIDDGEVGRNLIHLVVRLHVIGGVKGNGRQVCQLIEVRVVPFADMTIERNFCHVASRIGWSDISNIAKPARDVDVGIAHRTNCTFFIYNIKWYGIHEVGTIGTLEESQQHTSRSQAIVAR